MYVAFAAENDMRKMLDPPEYRPHSGSLLDFAGAAAAADTRAAASEPPTPDAKTNVIDELGDIFSTDGGTNIAEPLKPVNLMGSDDTDLLGDKSNKQEGWNELDSLGEQLMKQSLPENARRIDSFTKTTKKIPMVALEKNSPKHETQSTSNGAIFDLDFFTKKTEEAKSVPVEPKPFSLTDDVMVDISPDETANASSLNNNLTLNASPVDNILDVGLPLDNGRPEENLVVKDNVEKRDNVKKSEVKPLTDINVTLQSVHPSKVPPLTAFEEDDGVTVVLHFCRDKPRPDVNVIVISTTSKSSSPIEDYKFQAVVPKGCKVRLLTASGTSLPANNPFLPPPALTQVMLVARPEAAAVSLKFVVTYSREDDTTSEMGEVKQLPLDDI